MSRPESVTLVAKVKVLVSIPKHETIHQTLCSPFTNFQFRYNTYYSATVEVLPPYQLDILNLSE